MSVVQTLSDAIASWLEKRPNLSLNALARLANVSYSSIRRCAQKEAEPSQKVALGIAAIVLSETDYRAFTAKHYPNLKTFVSDLNHAPTTDIALDEFIKSDEHLKIIVLASGERGIDETDVKDKFGLPHVSYFQEVVAAGLLTKKGDKWVFDKDVGYVSLENARRWMGTFLSMYDRRCDDITGAAASYAGWQELNQSGVLAYHQATLEYCQALHKIALDPSMRGDIVVIYGALLNVVKGLEKLT